MESSQDLDPSKIQPFESQNSMVFIGATPFDNGGQHAVFGMITGCKSTSPGLDKGFEIRRVLTRAPRMEVQLASFIGALQRTALTQKDTFGIGWFFRDNGGWGLGKFFEDCRFVKSYIEMSGSIPIAEDVMILSFEKEIDITEQIQQRVTLAAPGDVTPITKPRGALKR